LVARKIILYKLHIVQWLNTYHLYLLSEISGAGDIEHCTQLEATLVERLALARLNLVSLTHGPQTGRTILQLWLLLCFLTVLAIWKNRDGPLGA